MTNKEAIEILRDDEQGKHWSELGFSNVNEFNEAFDEAYDMAIKALEDRPHGEFTIDELITWLNEIAFYNSNNDLGLACLDIIGRLDRFKRFVADMRVKDELGEMIDDNTGS